MHNPAKFWDRIAERYSRRPVADEATYRTRLKITQEYLRPDMEVLEFGCGTGSTAIEHAPRVKCIHAIDISAKMIEIARRKADGAHVGNVSFERATLDEARVPDNSLDAVLGLNVLHLLDDLDGGIARVHRMLKPDGVFVSSTPCIGDSMAYLRFILPIGRVIGLIPGVLVFTLQELTASLNAAGFHVVRCWEPGRHKPVLIVAKKQ